MSGKAHTHSAPAGASSAAAAARESSAESRYRLLFERNPVGLYRTSLEGRILDCNDACARIFGFASREEFLSHRTSEFYFDSAERERSIGRLQREGVVRNLELRMRRRDGATVWVLESAILLSSGNEPPVCEGSLVDISDLKRMDERFEIERAHLEQLFENTPEAIATLDNHNRILRLNREFTRLFGYTSEEACGRDINDLIVPIERHQEGLKVSQLLTQGQGVNIETVRRRK